MTERVIIYTDGACKGNPGPGGWGVVMQYRDREKELYGGELATTNNRMELMAAIQALENLKRPCLVCVVTDSVYVSKGISEWLPNWVRRGWKTAGNGAVKNADLWQRLVRAREPHRVEWQWVKGHSGHPGNERADILANKGVTEALSPMHAQKR
ncbi:MAG: ribonuclease [Proteobacteria bacterium]|nr:ribonuclease [Pseudomonadota bacterium]